VYPAITLQLWYEYWRGMFPAVTQKQIIAFEESYRGGAEEAADVLAAYVQYEVDMDALLDAVMCARPEDEDRFVHAIREAVRAKKVPAFPAFTDLYGGGGAGGAAAPSKRGASAAARAKRARVSRAEGEAVEAEAELASMRAKHAAKGGAGGAGASLEQLILSRQAERSRGE
jgi:hypothetical protein